MSSLAPALDTARLTLRGHALSDFADTEAMWADPQVTRYIGGRPFSTETAWMRFLRHPGHWALLGFGFWVVRERGSGAFVGEVGLADFRRDLLPPLGELPEAGWVLAPSAHGRGFATEAMTAALSWAATHFRSSAAACLIAPENQPSLRVADKLGFRERHRTTRGESDVIVLVR
jgi:RimJ/RimL family protein N-acetyltransferase